MEQFASKVRAIRDIRQVEVSDAYTVEDGSLVGFEFIKYSQKIGAKGKEDLQTVVDGGDVAEDEVPLFMICQL